MPPRPIRNGRSLRKRLVWLAFAVSLFLLFPTAAFAQEVQITPNFSQVPARDTGGWTFKMAWGAIILGVLVGAFFVVAYLRFAPQFQGQDEEPESAPIRRVPPVIPPVAATAAMAAASVPAAAAVVTVPSAAAQSGAQATPADPAAPVPPAAAQAAPRQEGPVELDQETLDRVLKEELDKGTDRRVAEGRARSAAVRAARRKAQG